MKQILRGILSIVLAILVVVLGFVIYGNYKQHQEQTKQLEVTPSPSPIALPSPSPEPEEQEPTNVAEMTLNVCGDIVCHTGLNAEALKEDGTYDYAPIFSGAWDPVNAADYSICTLETTFPLTAEYTGYPQFKSPESLATGLKSVGFDLINTANNHSVDSYKSGIDRTLEILDQNGLDHVGTYASQEERDKNNGILVKEINGIKIAFLSFTYGTNAIPVTGFEYAVNIYNNDYMTTLTDVNYDLLSADMAAARELDTDLIIVLTHWGNEYQLAPNKYQTDLADFLFSEGADLVLGGHCHVPEPMELRRVTDKDGNEKTGFVAYCLGNLVSCQNQEYTDLTAALNIDIEKNLDNGETYIKSVSYTPLFMVDLSDYGITADWTHMLMNLRYSIESYESGNNLGVIDDNLYNAMKTGLQNINEIMGAEFDYAAGGVDAIKWTSENS